MEQGTLIFVVFFAVIFIIFQVAFIRRIFKILKTEAYQQSSLLLLKQIAIKLGVENDKVNEAMNYFKKFEK